MAQPWRILQYEGAIYHVLSRGVGRGNIYLTNDDYSIFLDNVASSREKFNLDIFAFVLMSNHKRSGHLFQGRDKSVLVENESYWHILSLYIHLNPMRASMVKKRREYKCSKSSNNTHKCAK